MNRFHSEPTRPGCSWDPETRHWVKPSAGQRPTVNHGFNIAGPMDAEIAPLFLLMYEVGLRPSDAWWDDARREVWISFFDQADLLTFLNMVAGFQSGNDSMYNRINRQLVASDP